MAPSSRTPSIQAPSESVKTQERVVAAVVVAALHPVLGQGLGPPLLVLGQGLQGQGPGHPGQGHARVTGGRLPAPELRKSVQLPGPALAPRKCFLCHKHRCHLLHFFVLFFLGFV